jgi:pimeloyl-ACP methyl ester carboxylesterase
MTRRATLLASIPVALVLIGAGVYLARDMEGKTLDAIARAGATGQFVRLRDGVTQYELSGPHTGRTVVLLSGATVPFYMWDPTRDALVANGFRVLRYNYFGRGFSDRPALRYDLASYDEQLTELLDTLGIREPVDVAGISMGGVIAANFADRHTARVRSVVLMDPVFGYLSATPFPLGVPGVGEFVMTVAAPTLAKGQLDDFLHPGRYPDWVARYEVQMQYKGFRRSMLATLRGDTFKRPVSSFGALARSQVPMLILWGREDRTSPLSKSDTVRAAFPRAEFHAIDGAAHLPQVEQAEIVDSVLVKFLRERG